MNNKLEGACRIYYASGELYISCSYKHDALYGDYSVFTKGQDILLQEVYERGVNISKSIAVKSDLPNAETGLPAKSLPLIDVATAAKYEAVKQEYLAIKAIEVTTDDVESKKGFVLGISKIGKVVSGVQAYQDRKSSQQLKQACESYYEEAQQVTEISRQQLNNTINQFGKYRLESLQHTTGRFLGLLKDMNKINRIKEYEILENIGINSDAIQKMERLDMDVTTALKSTATISALGAAAAMGTPALVTGTVSALASASTGTAISSLSGAAATKAVLAWLGGGTLASGGGGVAVGATVLSSLTIGATAGVGLIAAGLIASTYYSKKLTEAKEFQKQVETNVADMELLWCILEGIKHRTDELSAVTYQLEQRLKHELAFLEPLAVDYLSNNHYYNAVFQRVGLLAKSMSDLAQTPLLDDSGTVSVASARIIQETHKVLNTTLVNHG